MKMIISPLQFALATVPSPPLASPTTGNPNKIDTLTVVASNINSILVTVVAIRISIPFGTGASQLTDNASIIVNTPANWSVDSEQSSTSIDYTFTPNTGFADLPSQQSVSFIFQNITVNQIPGTVQKFRAYGCINDDVPPNCHYVDLPLTKFPDGWGEVSFTATPVNINVGDPVVLNWNGPSGATYSIQYYDATAGQIVNIPAPGGIPLASNGVYPGQNDPLLTQSETCVFSMIVIETIGQNTYSCQMQQTVTIKVPEVLSIIAFNLSTGELGPGESCNITWETQLANNCTLQIQNGSNGISIGAANDTIMMCSISSPDETNLMVYDKNRKMLGELGLPVPNSSPMTLILTAFGSSDLQTSRTQPINLASGFLQPPVFTIFNIIAQYECPNGVIATQFDWDTVNASSAQLNWQSGESINIGLTGNQLIGTDPNIGVVIYAYGSNTYAAELIYRPSQIEDLKPLPSNINLDQILMPGDISKELNF